MSLYRVEIDQTFTWKDLDKKVANEHTIRSVYFCGVKLKTDVVKTSHDIDNVENLKNNKLGFLQDR